MKKQIAIAMGLAVLSTPALATKARLEALGEDSFGSQFIEDNRNIFLNAATVNFHKDIVTYEWGTTGDTNTTTYDGTDISSGGVTNSDQDLASSPKAEGGFLKASGNMVYGLHFGSESNVSNGLRALAMGADAVGEENNIDLFVGGDAGIQWGASVTHSQSKDEQGGNDIEQSATRLRLGGVSGNISAFALINVGNKAENGTAEFDGKSGYQLGGTYEMNDMYYMLQYRTFSGEDANSDELTASRTWVGAAKAYKLNDRATVWLSGWYKMNQTESDFTFNTGNSAAAIGEIKENFLPVTLAAEVDVKEWLTLRGSVGHVVFGTEEDDDGDEASINNTFVNAGASLVFGDFQVDGLIGTSDQASTSVSGTSTEGGNGTLRTDALLSRVSMLYRF